MAVRRSTDQREEQDYGYDDAAEQRFLGDPGGGGFQQSGGGRVDEFGNVVPDFGGDPNFPTPFVDYTPEEIAGNTERGVDLKGPAAVPTTGRPAPAPTSGPQNTFGLPQGVSVNEGMFEGVPNSGNTIQAPAMPNTPQTGGGVMNAIPESGTSTGPMRRSAIAPSIYGESKSPMLAGRADGLLGGGKGISGAESSGALQPSEMFQKLLQMFRQG